MYQDPEGTHTLDKIGHPGTQASVKNPVTNDTEGNNYYKGRIMTLNEEIKTLNMENKALNEEIKALNVELSKVIMQYVNVSLW